MNHLIIVVTLAATAFAAKMPVDRVPVSTVPVVGGVGENVVATPSVPVGTLHKDKVVHPVHNVVNHDPHVPQNVQNVVDVVHHHVPQVGNHHVGVGVGVGVGSGSGSGVGVKENVVVPNDSKVPDVVSGAAGVGVSVAHVGVPHHSEKVTVPTSPTTHAPHHHVGGHEHVVHNVPNVAGVVPPVDSGVHQHHTVPQHVVDKVNKVEQHVQQVMHQAHQHIPQVINHHIAQQKQKQQQKQQEQHAHVHHSTTATTTTTTTTHDPHSVHGVKVPHVTPAPGVVDTHVPHHPVVTVKTTTM